MIRSLSVRQTSDRGSGSPRLRFCTLLHAVGEACKRRRRVALRRNGASDHPSLSDGEGTSPSVVRPQLSRISAPEALDARRRSSAARRERTSGPMFVACCRVARLPRRCFIAWPPESWERPSLPGIALLLNHALTGTPALARAGARHSGIAVAHRHALEQGDEILGFWGARRDPMATVEQCRRRGNPGCMVFESSDLGGNFQELGALGIREQSKAWPASREDVSSNQGKRA